MRAIRIRPTVADLILSLRLEAAEAWGASGADSSPPYRVESVGAVRGTAADAPALRARLLAELDGLDPPGFVFSWVPAVQPLGSVLVVRVVLLVGHEPDGITDGPAERAVFAVAAALRAMRERSFVAA